MNLLDGNLAEVLHSSLEMLQRKPVLFVPKLVSSTVGAIWFIGFLENYGSTVHYLISMPFLIFLGVLVSVFVSAMVKGSDEDKENILKYSLGEIKSRAPILILTTLLLLTVTFAISIPLSVGIFFYTLNGSFVPLFLGGGITLIVSLIFGFAIYFLPATLISTKSTAEAFKKSFTSSNENRRDVVVLTIFSFLLLIFASASSGIGETLGYIGFVAGRLVSSIVNTYLYVVSPKYYFSS